MNTQIFFNPMDPAKNNYWHRDGQYHLSLEEQQAALSNSTVLHCRIALRDEPGIELVPQSHRQWDTEEELAVRMQTGIAKHYHDLTTGHSIALNAGDLLVFSANMIHRGLYGGDRLALDIIYCDNSEELQAFKNPDCLPDKKYARSIEQPRVFEL